MCVFQLLHSMNDRLIQVFVFFCVWVSFSTFFCRNTGEPQRFSTSDLKASLSDFSTQFSPQVKKKEKKTSVTLHHEDLSNVAVMRLKQHQRLLEPQYYKSKHTYTRKKKKSSHNQKSVNRPDGSICCVPRFLFNQPVLCGSSRCCESC